MLTAYPGMHPTYTTRARVHSRPAEMAYLKQLTIEERTFLYWIGVGKRYGTSYVDSFDWSM